MLSFGWIAVLLVVVAVAVAVGVFFYRKNSRSHLIPVLPPDGLRPFVPGPWTYPLTPDAGQAGVYMYEHAEPMTNFFVVARVAEETAKRFAHQFPKLGLATAGEVGRAPGSGQGGWVADGYSVSPGAAGSSSRIFFSTRAAPPESVVVQITSPNSPEYQKRLLSIEANGTVAQVDPTATPAQITLVKVPVGKGQFVLAGPSGRMLSTDVLTGGFGNAAGILPAQARAQAPSNSMPHTGYKWTLSQTARTGMLYLENVCDQSRCSKGYLAVNDQMAHGSTALHVAFITAPNDDNYPLWVSLVPASSAQ